MEQNIDTLKSEIDHYVEMNKKEKEKFSSQLMDIGNSLEKIITSNELTTLIEMRKKLPVIEQELKEALKEREENHKQIADLTDDIQNNYLPQIMRVSSQNMNILNKSNDCEKELDECTRLTNEFVKKIPKCNDLTGLINQMKQQITILKKEMDTLSIQNTNLSNSQTLLKNENLSLKGEKDKITNLLSNEINKYKTKIEEYDKEAPNIRQLVSQLTFNLEKIKNENNNIKDKQTIIETENLNLKRDKEQIQKLYLANQDKIRQLENTISELKTDNDSLTNKLKTQESNLVLQQELESNKKTIQKLENEKTELQKQNLIFSQEIKQITLNLNDQTNALTEKIREINNKYNNLVQKDYDITNKIADSYNKLINIVTEASTKNKKGYMSPTELNNLLTNIRSFQSEVANVKQNAGKRKNKTKRRGKKTVKRKKTIKRRSSSRK